MTVGLF